MGPHVPENSHAKTGFRGDVGENKKLFTMQRVLFTVEQPCLLQFRHNFMCQSRPAEKVARQKDGVQPIALMARMIGSKT